MIINRQEIKIVGTMAVTGFPWWKHCLINLQSIVDELYIRFDATVGDRNVCDQITETNFPKLKKLLVVSHKTWNRYNWREQMLRMLDDVAPNIVVNLDEDEAFEDGIVTDIEKFWESNYKQLAFKYRWPMPGKAEKLYPTHPHVKVFKWQPRLTFKPYKGSARLSNIKSVCEDTETKILHYCWYDDECVNYRKKRKKRKHKKIRELSK